ncbi:MAG: hypothetical protein V1672_05465 [Candidatus Diapherotrites archaeon]
MAGYYSKRPKHIESTNLRSFRPTKKTKKPTPKSLIPNVPCIPVSEIKIPKTKDISTLASKEQSSVAEAHRYEYFLQGGYNKKQINANPELTLMLKKAIKRHAEMQRANVVEREYLRLNRVLSDLGLINQPRKKR